MNQKTKIVITAIAFILICVVGVFSFLYADTAYDYITGLATARAIITPPVPQNCTVNITEGLNTVSFICETGRPMVQVFNESNFSVIYRFDSSSQTRPWRIYKEGLPDYVVQGISSIWRNEGYIIIANELYEYTHNGSLSAQTQVQLRKGWNLAAFPLNDERDTDTAFQPIIQNVKRVETYDEGWQTYIPGGIDQIQVLKPMTAYWIYVNETVVWSVS